MFLLKPHVLRLVERLFLYGAHCNVLHNLRIWRMWQRRQCCSGRLGGDDARDAPQLFCVESDEWTARLLRAADIHRIRAAQSMAGGAQRQRLVR